MVTRILLVEDNQAHATLIRRAFKKQKERFDLEVVESLAAARSALAAIEPDLAIVDLNLPDGRGVELLGGTSEDGDSSAGNPFPVIIMTGHGDETAAVEAIKAGALDYVVKSAESLIDLPHLAQSVLREWGHIDRRRRAEAALQASERRYRALYDENPSMFFTVDRAGIIVSANRFAAEQLGYGTEDLVGRSFWSLCDESRRQMVAEQIAECFRYPGNLHRWEVGQNRFDGSVLWVRTTARTVNGDPSAAVLLLVCEDLTEAHQLSLKLSHQASHDPLTSLYNRREFEHRLSRALEDIRGSETKHAVCYLDLDQFKVINDTCGHIAGDVLLRQLGSLLLARIRKHDMLARLGGDEFGALIQQCSPDDAIRVAESLRQLITDFRFVWEDKTFAIGVSIGVVPVDSTWDNITSILAAADSACYAAKDQGRNRIHVFHEEDSHLAQRRGEMQSVARIHKAFEENLFRLSYQPIVPVGSPQGDNSGFQGAHYEVLVRMLDEEAGLLGPGAFLPAAERYDLIGKVDFWVLDTALSWLARHPRHLKNLRICSINLSGTSLGNREFLDFTFRKLDETGIPPEKICFEITETMAIANLASAIDFIRAFRELGCLFALDDFGSGVSSFAYLKNLPVDFLKIDGMFVKDIVDDPIDEAVVKSIIDISRVLGLRTIAEFVENDAILEKLQHLGVDYAQGYGIGRPRLFSERPN